ncbi:hypothetical protein ES703_38570 [subsurface metagenome]
MSNIPQVKTEEQARTILDMFGLEARKYEIHHGCESSLGLYKQNRLVWFGAKWYVDRYKVTQVVLSFLEYWWGYLAPDIQAQIRVICGDKEKL